MVLQPESCGIEPFILAYLLVAGQQDIGITFRKRSLKQSFLILAQAGKSKGGFFFNKTLQIGGQSVGAGQDAGARNLVDFVDRHPFCQQPGNLENGPFAHAVNQKICLGILQMVRRTVWSQ